MTALQDGILAFFAAVGIACVVWLAGTALLHGGRSVIPGLTLVLPLQGDAPAMEQDVRELRWLLHRLPGARLVLADCGMTAEARRLAEYFALREEGAVVTDAAEFRIR